MTEHDERVCLRCGAAAGDHCFCESCRSYLESSTGVPCCATAQASDPSYSATAAREGRSEKAGAGADANRDRIACEPSGAAVQVELDPGSAEGSTLEGHETTREVARFEELLTPKPETVDEELGYRQADAAGDAQAATNLGVLLEKKGDLKGAVAAYRRADRRGDVNGSFNLGCLLAETGDLRGAKAALRRADDRGDACGASNLGVLLEREGDPDGALAAYRRADERGDAVGAFNLGLLLAAAGDIAGAHAAYLRAAERGDPEVRDMAQARAEAMAAEAEPAATAEPEPVISETADTGEPAEVSASVLREALRYEQAAQPEVESAADAGPRAQARGPESVPRLWIGHTTRKQWIAALGVLALLGLVVVLAGRSLRRFS